jgi:hypothetical protein
MNAIRGTRSIRWIWFALPMALLAASPRAQLELCRPADVPADRIRYTWDAYNNNVLYVFHHGWDDSMFDLHFFEELLVPAPGWPWTSRLINDSLFDVQPIDDGFGFHIRQADAYVDFESTGTVKTLGNQILFEATVANYTPLYWTNGNALICFRSRNTESFQDYNGERVFLEKKSDGQLHSSYELFGRSSPMFGAYVNQTSSLYEPMVWKYDQSMTHWMTMVATPPFNITGNRDPGLNCIHTNVPLDIAAGGTATVRVTITFHELSGVGDWWNYE